MSKKLYKVHGKVWKYPGNGGWHFLYVSKEDSAEIRHNAYTKKVGWSFVKIIATLGKTSWKTTLFPTKEGPFLISVKAHVRKKEGILDGDEVLVSFVLE